MARESATPHDHDHPHHPHEHARGAGHAAHSHDHGSAGGHAHHGEREDHGNGEHDHHHHHHGHGHGIGPETPEARILGALLLTAGFMVVEVVVGILANSLALLSDAGHMLADAGALALALVAQRVAARPRTIRRTYGSRRAEILAAFANGIALGVSAVWVIFEAVGRWKDPPAIKGGWMLAVATLGLLVNLAAAWILSRGHGHNANTRAALAHVLSDAAGSVAAMAAAVCILAFGWRRADPAVSIGLSILILYAAYKLCDQAVHVLMEGAPSRLPVEKVDHVIRETPGVAELHDLHVWTISEGFDSVTVHVVLDGTRHGTDVARDVSQRIRDRFDITHVTVQPEAPAHHSSLRPPESLVRRPP